MRVLQEVTQWDDGTQNHIYFLSDDRTRMHAYIRSGTNDVFRFTKPLRFVASRRKFVELDNTWGVEEEEKPTNPVWKIAGSKGNEYTVELTATGYTCSCPGARFRGHCKHIEQVQQAGS